MRHTRKLQPLKLGQQVLIQDKDKGSKNYKQWNRTRVVVDVGKQNDYEVRVDRSSQVTKRNRQYLRPVHTTSNVFTPPKQETLPLMPQTWTQPATKELDLEPRSSQNEYVTPTLQRHSFQTPTRSSVQQPSLDQNNTPSVTTQPTDPIPETPASNNQAVPGIPILDPIPKDRIGRHYDSWSIVNILPEA